MERGKEELAEAEIIKDSPDSPEPPNKKPLVEMDEAPQVEKAKGRAQMLPSSAASCAVSLHVVCV